MTATLGFHLLKVGHCSHPECIAQRGGGLSSVVFPALVGLLIHPNRGPMLFDTGYSDAFFRATTPFPERFYRWITPVSLPSDENLGVQLARHGYTPADIQHIFISHLHADHISGLIDFPHARLYAMRAEFDAKSGLSRIGRLRQGFLETLLPGDIAKRTTYAEDTNRVPLPDNMHPFKEAFDLLGDGSVLGIMLPGHTAGQIGLLFRTLGQREVFLVADACWSLPALRDDRPPTWIASQLFADKHAYLNTFASLRRLLSGRTDLLMVPSHCSATWTKVSNESL